MTARLFIKQYNTTQDSMEFVVFLVADTSWDPACEN